jgi:hypothetical protein
MQQVKRGLHFFPENERFENEMIDKRSKATA